MQEQGHKNGPAPTGKAEANNPSTEEGGVAPPRPVDQEPPESSEVEEGRRPTPVRIVMEGGGEEDGDRREKPRVVHDGETDLDWIVTVSGRSASGILPLRTVPLMELSFAKADEPGRPLRRALCCGEDLVDVPDHELLCSLNSSAPFREPMREPNGSGRQGRSGKDRRTPRD